MKATIDLGNIEYECFVLMPYGPKFDPIYEEVLRPAIKEVGLVPTRADLIYGSRRIMRDVWNKIRTARIVLAELTGRNANVLYELGLAHALGKPFVIITNSMDDVPFDLKDLRCIVYDKDHPKWGESLSRNVSRTMTAVLEESGEHGPLFVEIAFDFEYSSIDAGSADRADASTSEDERVADLTGDWALTQHWGSSTDTFTTLSLQQDGSSLSGYAVSSPLPETGENWMVSQEVSGSVRENQFELAATSYEILESGGELESWTLDNWRGTANGGSVVQGELFDEAGRRGTFQGTRST